MKIEIKEYIKDRIGDVLAFEKRLREEEDFWGWEIDEDYVRSVFIIIRVEGKTSTYFLVRYYR